MTVDPFILLANARAKELRGWPLVAALLHSYEVNGVDWWSGRGENKREALAAPEIQLAPTTAAQYIAIWESFGHLPPEELERARPRLLFQACAAIMSGDFTAEEALFDSQIMSWSSFVRKYRPEKFDTV